MATKPFNLQTLQELSFVRAKQWGHVLQKFEGKDDEEQELSWSDMSAIFEGEEENDGGDGHNGAGEAVESDGAEEASILKDVTNISNILKNFSVLPRNSTQLQSDQAAGGADGAANDSYNEDQEMRDLLDNTIPVLQEHKRRMRESGIDRVLNTFDPAKVEEKVGGWLRRQYAGGLNAAANTRWPRQAHRPHPHAPAGLDEAPRRVAYHSGSENDSSHSVDTVRYIRSSRPKPASHRKHTTSSSMTIKTYRMVKSKRDNLRQKYTVMVGGDEEEQVLAAHRRCPSHRKLATPKCSEMGLASGSRAIVKRVPQRSKVLRKRRSHEHRHRDLAYYLSSSCYSSDEEAIDGSAGGCACCLPRRPAKPKVKHQALRPACSCCPPTRQLVRSCQSLRYRRSRGRVCFTTSYTSSESTSFVEQACSGQKKCCPALKAKDVRSWKRESECPCRNEDLLCTGVRHLAETSTDSWLVENYESPRKYPVEKPPRQRRSNERYIDTPRTSEVAPPIKELSPVLMENWLAALQTESFKAKGQAKEVAHRNSIGKQQQQQAQLPLQQNQQKPRLAEQQQKIQLPQREQEKMQLPQQQQEKIKLPQQQQEKIQLPQQQQEKIQLPQQQQEKIQLPQKHQDKTILPLQQQQAIQPPLQQQQTSQQLQQQHKIPLAATTSSTQSDKAKGKKPKSDKGDADGKLAKKPKVKEAVAAKKMPSDMNGFQSEPAEVPCGGSKRKPSKEAKSAKASKKQSSKAKGNSGNHENPTQATGNLPKEDEEPRQFRAVVVEELAVDSEAPVESNVNANEDEAHINEDSVALQKDNKQRERPKKTKAGNRQGKSEKAKTVPDSTRPEEPQVATRPEEKVPQEEPMASSDDDDEVFARNLQEAIALSRRTFEKEVQKPKEPTPPPHRQLAKTTDTSSVCDESTASSRKNRSQHQLTKWQEGEEDPSEADSLAVSMLATRRARGSRSRIVDTPSSTSSICSYDEVLEKSLKPQPKSVKQRKLAKRMQQESRSNSSMEDSAFMASGGRVYNSTAIGDLAGGTADKAKSFANSTAIPGVTPRSRLVPKAGPKSKVRRRIPSPIPESLESPVVSSATDCAVVSSTTGAEPIRTQKGILLYTPQNPEYAPEETIRGGYFHLTEDCLKRVIGERTAGNFFKYYFGQKKFDCNRSRVYFRPPDSQTISDSESDADVFERMGRYGELVVSMDEDSNADE